jgi:hypothetical protein
MPSANLNEACSSSPTVLAFFLSLHLPKLQKPQNKIKQAFYRHKKTNKTPIKL